MTLELSGKAALVTGASRGLGRALAEALGARGAEIIAVDRSSAQLLGKLNTARNRHLTRV